MDARSPRTATRPSRATKGSLLSRARGTDPRFQAFAAEYDKIGGLTFNGAEQDRRLLVGFSREDFLAEAKALQAQLTDAAIETAARQMPPEWYANRRRAAGGGPQGRAAMRWPSIAGKYYRPPGAAAWTCT